MPKALELMMQEFEIEKEPPPYATTQNYKGKIRGNHKVIVRLNQKLKGMIIE